MKKILPNIAIFILSVAIGFLLGISLDSKADVKIPATTVYKTKTVHDVQYRDRPQPYKISVINTKNISSWPFSQAMSSWNEAGTIQFVFVTTSKLYTLKVKGIESETRVEKICKNEKSWGCYIPWMNSVFVWTGVPKNYRLTVLTHELGHVLGLPHEEKGVMNAQAASYMTKPTNEDLDWVYYTYRWIRK